MRSTGLTRCQTQRLTKGRQAAYAISRATPPNVGGSLLGHGEPGAGNDHGHEHEGDCADVYRGARCQESDDGTTAEGDEEIAAEHVPDDQVVSPLRAAWIDAAMSGGRGPDADQGESCQSLENPDALATPRAEVTMISAPPSMRTSMPIARINSTGDRRDSVDSELGHLGTERVLLRRPCPNSSAAIATPRATSMMRPLTLVTPPTARTANRTTDATLIGASLRTVAENRPSMERSARQWPGRGRRWRRSTPPDSRWPGWGLGRGPHPPR